MSKTTLGLVDEDMEIRHLEREMAASARKALKRSKRGVGWTIPYILEPKNSKSFSHFFLFLRSVFFSELPLLSRDGQETLRY